MYYRNYEEYMREILGYPVQLSSNFDTYNNFSNMQNEYMMQPSRYSTEILDLYPEIYKLLTPMIDKICEANTKPITRELIEQMTDEIYLNIESDSLVDEVVNIKVNLPEKRDANDNKLQNKSSNNISKIKDNRQELNKLKLDKNYRENKDRIEKSTKTQDKGNIAETSNKDIRSEENRQLRRRNNNLRDLIKILILNRLLGGGFRPPRPIPRPPRPPFPGGPGPGPNPRPPRPPFSGRNEPIQSPQIEPRNMYNIF